MDTIIKDFKLLKFPEYFTKDFVAIMKKTRSEIEIYNVENKIKFPNIKNLKWRYVFLLLQSRNISFGGVSMLD